MEVWPEHDGPDGGGRSHHRGGGGAHPHEGRGHRRVPGGAAVPGLQLLAGQRPAALAHSPGVASFAEKTGREAEDEDGDEDDDHDDDEGLGVLQLGIIIVHGGQERVAEGRQTQAQQSVKLE